MLRRLYHDQPASFAFTPANRAWAEAQIRKYPEGRQASAIIPLLWRAQEQEGWLTRPAIEHVADMLGMAYIRALEVATFYFMFQLQPVGSLAHVQVCGTLSCMIMGAEDLVAVCKNRIAAHAHELSEDGRFSWEEVECLGACTNAPMVQIGKDYYEDLTPEKLEGILDDLLAGRVPVPGPQNGRYAAEPLKGLTALTEYESGRTQYNASVELATSIGDTVKRIDGTEVPLVTPWIEGSAGKTPVAKADARGDVAGDKPDHAHGLKPIAKPRPPKEAPAEATPAPGPVEAAARADSTKTPPSAPATAADLRAAPTTVEGGQAAATDPNAAARTAAGLAAREADPALGAGERPATLTGGAVDPVAAKTAASEAAFAANPVAGPGTRPAALAAPRDGRGDNLQEIEGIGPVLEKLCHDLGIFHFDQIAGWGPEEVAWMDSNLKGFRGRVTRDRWVSQARIIGAEGLEAFRLRAKSNDY